MRFLIGCLLLTISAFAAPITFTIDCESKQPINTQTTFDYKTFDYKTSYKNLAKTTTYYSGDIAFEDGPPAIWVPIVLEGDGWFSIGETDDTGYFKILVKPNSTFELNSYDERLNEWSILDTPLIGIPSGKVGNGRYCILGSNIKDCVDIGNTLSKWDCKGLECIDGTLNFSTGDGGTASAKHDFSNVKTGDTYDLGFIVSNYGGGVLRFSVGGFIYEKKITANGVYNEVYVVKAKNPNNTIYFIDGTTTSDPVGFTGEVYDISCVKRSQQ